MNRRVLTGFIACSLIASGGGILAQDPAARGGRGAAKGGRPSNPATTEDLAKLGILPPLIKGAGEGDFSIGPDYTPAPEQKQRVGVPHGKSIEFFMNSSDSKVFSVPSPV